jgi:hypothetical protein
MKATVVLMLLLRLPQRSIILVCLLFSGSAVAVEDKPATQVIPNTNSIEDGIRLYLDGSLREAKTALQNAATASMDSSHENEALIYLAEIEYYLGERDAAWLTCQRIVQNDENYRPDPLVHPPEMLVFFETARLATVEQSRTSESSSITTMTSDRFSMLVFIPGASQYARGKRGLGVATGFTFTSLSVASFVLWKTMRTYDMDNERQGIQVFSSEDQQIAQRLLTFTELTRIGAAGVWAASLVQELYISPNISLTNRASRAEISVSGSW